MGPFKFLKHPFVWKTSLLIIVLLVAVVAIRGNRQSAQLAEAIESVRNSGEPITPDEWNDYISKAKGQTEPSKAWEAALAAASVVANKKEQAGLNCDYVFDERLELPHFGQPWEDFDAYVSLLAESEKEMVTIHKATDAGESMFYPYDFADFETHVDLTSNAIEASSLLALEALVKQRKTDLGGALRSLQTIHNTAKATDGAPYAFNYLTRLQIESMLYRGVAEVIRDQSVSDDQLQELQTLLRSIDKKQDLKLEIIASRVAGLDNLEESSIDTFMYIDLPFGIRLKATPRAKIRCVNRHASVVAVTEQPWHESLRSIPGIKQAWRDEDSWIMGWLPSADYYFVGQFYYGAIGTAQARSLDALIALELYRRREGQFPAGLDELVPDFLTEVPLDPFDGNPLRYRRDESGAVVYSVGKNLVDDQGSLKFAPAIEARPDIGFRLDRNNSEPSSSNPQASSNKTPE